MRNRNIEIIDSVPIGIEQAMVRGHEEYETSHGVVCAYRSFCLVFRTDGGDVIGALHAYTAYAEIYVEDLWVDAKHRNQGVGSKLLKELESQFAQKGYHNINLVTNAFQAVAFYQKCGFNIEFVRQNKQHPKLDKTFLIKYFDEEPQTQGILPLGN